MFRLSVFTGPCKLEMEKNFEDFVKLSTDAFEKQSQVNVHKKTKELTEFADNLLRQNFELRKDNLKMENMETRHENAAKQLSLHEQSIEKLTTDVASLRCTVEALAECHEKLKVTIAEQSKEFTASHDGLTERINRLEVVRDGQTEQIKHLQVVVDGLTERNNNVLVTGRNEEPQVTMSELHAAIKEIQDRMKTVEDKVI